MKIDGFLGSCRQLMGKSTKNIMKQIAPLNKRQSWAPRLLSERKCLESWHEKSCVFFVSLLGIVCKHCQGFSHLCVPLPAPQMIPKHIALRRRRLHASTGVRSLRPHLVRRLGRVPLACPAQLDTGGTLVANGIGDYICASPGGGGEGGKASEFGQPINPAARELWISIRNYRQTGAKRTPVKTER